MRKYDLEFLFEPIPCGFLRVRLEPLHNVPSKRIKIERLLEITNEIERTKELNEMINQIKNRDDESPKC